MFSEFLILIFKFYEVELCLFCFSILFELLLCFVDYKDILF